MRQSSTRGIRMTPALLCGFVSLLLALALALAPAAQAISFTPLSPVVGESVTFQTGGYECPGGTTQTTFTFRVNGVQKQSSSSDTYTTSFSAPGTYTVTLTIQGENGSCGGTQTTPVDVRAALKGTVAVSPDPPAPNQTTTLTASQTGGYPGYTYAWDTDNDGAFDDSDQRITQTVFTTVGPRVVRVQVTDSASHVAVATRTINVQKPTGTVTPPPPPAPCLKTISITPLGATTPGLSEFKTTGCFTKTGTGPDRWQTDSAVKLNGIAFPDFGQTFKIEGASTGYPGGRFVAPDSTIQLGAFRAYSGDIDWALPVGKFDEQQLLRTVRVPLGTKMFGLNVVGQISIKLGWDKSGHYATFPLHIELPAGINTTPYEGASRATGDASMRVDDGGPRFDGLQLKAENVWAGKIKLVETCFSFVPAGGRSIAPCEAPKLDGKPYLSCGTDATTDRWDGGAVIELPTGRLQLAAAGGLAGGNVSKLLGYADNLGNKVPLAPGVFLDRVGFGMCINPPPLQLRGDVGVGLLPTSEGATIAIDGTVHYTDSTPGTSWRLALGGTIKVHTIQVGSGSVTLRPGNGVDFKVQAGFNLQDTVSLDGKIEGWVDSLRGTWSVSGGVRACVGGEVCAEGSGLVSNVGAAGCVSIGGGTDYGTLAVSFDPFSVRFAESPPISAGFGYNWNTEVVQLFGGSCDFTSFSPVRQFTRLAGAGSAIRQRVARGTQAVSWRIHGTSGPPKVVVRGPGGTVIRSPAKGAAQRKGRWMIAENKTDGTTSLLLVKPRAGTWTIDGAMGAMSTPTRIDAAKSQAPPSLAGKVRGKGRRRVVQVVYAVPRGTKVQLVERAKGIAKTIAKRLRGRRCPQTPRTLPGSDEAILCARVRFTASRGPGGRRRIQALVTRKGIPVKQKTLASFKAPRQTLPARARALRIQRRKSSLLVSFPRLDGASRLVVSGKLSDGRRLGFDLRRKCRQLRIPGVRRTVAAKFTVAGIRYDLAAGPKRSIAIKSKAKSARTKRKLPRKGKVCR